jgi:hypothetical protein
VLSFGSQLLVGREIREGHAVDTAGDKSPLMPKLAESINLHY